MFLKNKKKKLKYFNFSRSQVLDHQRRPDSQERSSGGRGSLLLSGVRDVNGRGETRRNKRSSDGEPDLGGQAH